MKRLSQDELVFFHSFGNFGSKVSSNNLSVINSAIPHWYSRAEVVIGVVPGLGASTLCRSFYLPRTEPRHVVNALDAIDGAVSHWQPKLDSREFLDSDYFVAPDLPAAEVSKHLLDEKLLQKVKAELKAMNLKESQFTEGSNTKLCVSFPSDLQLLIENRPDKLRLCARQSIQSEQNLDDLIDRVLSDNFMLMGTRGAAGWVDIDNGDCVFERSYPIHGEFNSGKFLDFAGDFLKLASGWLEQGLKRSEDSGLAEAASSSRERANPSQFV